MIFLVQGKFKGFIYADSGNLALGALGAKDAISENLKQDAVRTRGFRFTRTEWFLNWNVEAAGEGPILIGLCGPGISAAEVEEAIEADPQSPDDTIPAPQAMRPYWPLAILFPDTGGKSTIQGVININWAFPESEVMQIFAYNLGTGALTTGSQVDYFLKHFGAWLND